MSSTPEHQRVQEFVHNATRVSVLTSELRRLAVPTNPDQYMNLTDELAKILAANYSLSETFSTVQNFNSAKSQRAEVMKVIRAKESQHVLPTGFEDVMVLSIIAERLKTTPNSNLKLEILKDVWQKANGLMNTIRVPQVQSRLQQIRSEVEKNVTEIGSAAALDINKQQVESVDEFTLITQSGFIDWAKLINPAYGEPFISMNENRLRRSLVDAARKLSTFDNGLSKRAFTEEEIKELTSLRDSVQQEVNVLVGHPVNRNEGQKVLFIINRLLYKNREAIIQQTPGILVKSKNFIEPDPNDFDASVYNDVFALLSKLEKGSLDKVRELSVRIARSQHIDAQEVAYIDTLIATLQHTLNRQVSLESEFKEVKGSSLRAETAARNKKYKDAILQYLNWAKYLKSNVNIVGSGVSFSPEAIEEIERNRPSIDSGIDPHYNFFVDSSRRLGKSGMDWLIQEGYRSLKQFGAQDSQHDRSINARNAFEGYLAALGKMKDEPHTKESPYWSEFFNNRLRIHDILIKHSQGRYLTTATDALGAEAGIIGFDLKTTDFFFLDPERAKLDTATGEQRFKNWKYVETCLKIFEDRLDMPSKIPNPAGGPDITNPLNCLSLIEDSRTFMRTADTIKGDFVKMRYKGKPITEELSAEAIDEVVEMAVSLGVIGNLRLHDYTMRRKKGDSPPQGLNPQLPMLKEYDPAAAEFNNATKGVNFFNLAQIFNVPERFFQKMRLEYSKVTDPSRRRDLFKRITNIRESLRGTKLAEETIGPPREKPDMHFIGRKETLKTAYPTPWEFMVIRAIQRRELGINLWQVYTDGRKAFIDFEHKIFGNLPSPESGDMRKYQKELIAKFNEIIVGGISGLKGNMLVDWTDVGYMMRHYIDKMFRVYTLADDGPIGVGQLKARIINALNNIKHTYNSAGNVIIKGHQFHAHHDELSIDTIPMSIFKDAEYIDTVHNGEHYIAQRIPQFLISFLNTWGKGAAENAERFSGKRIHPIKQLMLNVFMGDLPIVGPWIGYTEFKPQLLGTDAKEKNEVKDEKKH